MESFRGPGSERKRLGIHRDPSDNVCIGIEGECWESGALPNNGGYTKQHRLVASLFADVAGRHVHHTCGNRRCNNPDHLRVMDMREHYDHHLNAVCLRGHDMWDEKNVYWRNGQRWCRACGALKAREYRRAKRESAKNS